MHRLSNITIYHEIIANLDAEMQLVANIVFYYNMQ